MKSIEVLVEQALGLNPGSITEEDGAETIAEWDSLGHLKVLTELDSAYDGRLAEIDALADAKSIREVKSILREKGILET